MSYKQHLEAQCKRPSNKHSFEVHLLVDGVTNDGPYVAASHLVPFHLEGQAVN